MSIFVWACGCICVGYLWFLFLSLQGLELVKDGAGELVRAGLAAHVARAGLAVAVVSIFRSFLHRWTRRYPGGDHRLTHRQ